MRRALRAEWTKWRTVPSTALAPWLAVALTLAASAVVAATAEPGTTVCPTAETCDTVRLTLSGVQLGQVPVVVAAALTVTGEYGTGLIGPTLTAVPRRLRVLTTKAVTVTAVALAAGLLSVAGCLIIARALLPGSGLPVPPADATTWRAALATVLYLALITLVSLGIGALLRNIAAAVTTVLGLLFLLPILARLLPNGHLLEKYAPTTAGLALQTTKNLEAQLISPSTGLTVLTAYAAAATTLGALRFHTHDP
ncbi:ABC transporter permease [Actinomadura rudentiformis]|uniref:ABC transporter permease n=1 Tax=Actinomadura rudentiformis TaxID=359158 RepID=A0A6H9YQP2_9ACTN|nr:ABC transporter permease [Actinomadura rudentiformis]KAB2350234.1 ABC transporter permease [Actinomadura rudentiformis]